MAKDSDEIRKTVFDKVNAMYKEIPETVGFYFHIEGGDWSFVASRDRKLALIAKPRKRREAQNERASNANA